ncbi:DUF4139 domain-containing protein [Maritimibacter fusiformis]|uniref:Mucoidy inhibitor MuiA family protein n=1 Tax=Maritimibacter fusiformis TaxID=2603819 RepID=A0A5D0RK83_9RHOB|nr:DUF4139 domain-containing protein [Maritimibacter fusiformis]TYB82030.1 mucoidy inhibitor MuiA family protein [Maritimibacter fusiformis]
MRLATVSLIALIAATPALADEVFSQAPVSAVTVYPQGAEMTLRATVDLPAGEHRVFLPYAGVDDLTALPRVRTSPGVAIGALGFRRAMSVDREALFTEAQAAAFDRLEALDDAVAVQEDEIAAARSRVQALDARLAFLAAAKPGEDVDAETMLALLDTITNETGAAQADKVAASAALRPLLDALEELQGERKAAQRAFDRLAPPAAVNDMLVVDVTVATAGPVTLELTELTRDAKWEVDYDLDLDRDAGSLDIARKLIVVQETGRVWSEADLTLSTARPGEAVGPSPVDPDQARIHDEITLMRGDAAPAPMVEREMGAEVAELFVEDPKMTTAALQVDGLSLSYVYPDPVTIASGEAAELALDTLTVEADPTIEAAPRYDDTAFVMATLTNTTGEPILPGMANILRDGHLVGREQISLIPAGAETTLPFGPIEGIRLDTIFARNAEGDAGIITRSNTREQQITFTVENLTEETQQVRALFPLTYSEQEDLRVKVTAQPAPDERDIDDKRGVSAWDLSLAPGETKAVSITVKLDWPEGKMLNWYP